jgi:small neutral amino acid transporter SnatA (MarC family)
VTIASAAIMLLLVMDPLATPLMAGPSAIAVVLLMASKDPSRILDWSLAILIAWLITAAVLLCAHYLARFLGKRGTVATQRLMGMILTAISVQMFLSGLEAYMESLRSP